MGLACSQARLLSLTARKADCEYGISINSMHKMALTREMTELSQEYYSKLQSKKIAYYAGGQYNKMTYSYLMGDQGSLALLQRGNLGEHVKSENSMVLTDYKGQVVLSQAYANAITSVLGAGVQDAYGRGSTFSANDIPKILAALVQGITADQFATVMDGENLINIDEYYKQNTMTGESTGETTEKDSGADQTEMIQRIIDFYYPIFMAAASNGWTTEYNEEMKHNEDYLSDALVTGTFQLESVDDNGVYNERGSLTYFVTAGLIEARNDSDVREEITAWYNAEKERLTEKETYYDLEIDNLSTELEAVNTEIQSIQTLIDDAVSSVFDWGSG